MTRYARIATPLGPLYATALEGRLAGVYFEGGRHAPPIDPGWLERPDDEVLQRCAAQLAEYFAGARRAFDLPLAPAGSAFQQRVWRAIAAIPWGATRSYAQLAGALGAPDCARAVGAATGRNPWSIVVPCHRVLGARGALTGYAGGLERKARLLALEGVLLHAAA